MTTPRVGMFDPLPPGTAAAAPPAKPASEWQPIMPVPEDASAPPVKHPTLGRPPAVWDYLDADGRLLGRVCRFDTKGGKEIRSLVFAEHPKHGRQWRWLGLPKPRPLYGLDRLAAQPGAPVAVCEGEKAADAAEALLPDHVAVTSPSGSKAAKAADWAALAGRKVVVWPDADEPGQAYARDVVAMLSNLSVPPVAVAIALPPPGVVEGWDAADALAEGWTAAQAAELVGAAQPATTGNAASARRKPAARDALIALVDDAELWHDAEQVAYATVPKNGHRENYEITSRSFRNWLAWRAYEAAGASPSGQVIDDALRVAEGLAINRGPCYRTWRRVAEYDGRIYLDLGCAHWRAVEVSAGGWRMVDAVPVKFMRSRGMEALPEPEAGELIEALREFVNVESGGDFRLICAWLAATLRPSGPFPVLAIAGQQGTSKSTLARICRLLIDPNASPIRSAPKDERDLIVSAFNAWFLVYDNLSSMPVWLSDAFCRLSTGGGFATRELHTDRGEAIFSAMRPIIVNGIGDLAVRPDLAERIVLEVLPQLSDDRRRTEREFWVAFEAKRPLILGALLDAVAAGLRHLPDTVLENPPRMADFATWGEACASGFGWEPGEFLADYAENRRDAVTVAASASPLVPVIEVALGASGLGLEGFDGTAHELLSRLRDVCSEAQQKQRWFPGTDSQMGSGLRRIVSLLASRGIETTFYRAGRMKIRKIVLRCVSEKVFNELRDRMLGKIGDDAEPMS
jgi:putative DNA primase/helicase